MKLSVKFSKLLIPLTFIGVIVFGLFLNVKLTQKPKNIIPGYAALSGNCNTDNVVDILDFQLLSNSFGKSSGQTGYNANCDFNSDSKNDILDFQILSNNFGKTGTTGTATPKPTSTPAVTQGPVPTLPIGGTDYLFINRSTLMALPVGTAGWNALKSAADSSATPSLCNQDNIDHPKVTFASALVYARTGDTAYYNKAKSYIFAAMATLPMTSVCSTNTTNGALSFGRQLAAYVFAADLIKLNDPTFNSWVSKARTYNVGTHGAGWTNLRNTARVSANNWGIHALTSVTAADRFLGDSAMVAEDWKIFSAYGVAFGWPFIKTGDYQEAWSCVPSNSSQSSHLPIAINTPCTKNGVNLDGAPVEDASRTGFGSFANYPAEAIQGYVVQAILLSRAGYDAWGVNNSQVKRVQLIRERMHNLNYAGPDKFVNWVTNKIYGMNQPTVTPGFGRNFGFTDWLYWGK